LPDAGDVSFDGRFANDEVTSDLLVSVVHAELVQAWPVVEVGGAYAFGSGSATRPWRPNTATSGPWQTRSSI
jgi:hypothetical protein